MDYFPALFSSTDGLGDHQQQQELSDVQDAVRPPPPAAMARQPQQHHEHFGQYPAVEAAFFGASSSDTSTFTTDTNAGNYSMTTSVTIHVTPEEQYILSWVILWSGFFLAFLLASYQILSLERKWTSQRASLNVSRQVTPSTSPGQPASFYYSQYQQQQQLNPNASTRYSTYGGTRASIVSTTMPQGGTSDLERGGGGLDGETNANSADLARTQFRFLLWFALTARAITILIQVRWRQPFWIPFVADTFPEIIFASAWTVVISFFVQLVGIAVGSYSSDGGAGYGPGMGGNNAAAAAAGGYNAGPSIGGNTSSSNNANNSNMLGWVIQVTAFVLYLALILTSLFVDPVASVLLYALFCCIYAALFGTTLYFCPRLYRLLQPVFSPSSSPSSGTNETNSNNTNNQYNQNTSNNEYSRNSRSMINGLNLRLLAGSLICLFAFGGRTFLFARKVVAPPPHISWWWQYGCLELLPSMMFLLMMHPNTTKAQDGNTTDGENNNGTVILSKPPVGSTSATSTTASSTGSNAYDAFSTTQRQHVGGVRRTSSGNAGSHGGGLATTTTMSNAVSSATGSMATMTSTTGIHASSISVGTSEATPLLATTKSVPPTDVVVS